LNILNLITLQVALSVALRRPMPSRYSLEVEDPQSQHFVGVAIEDEDSPKLRFIVQRRFWKNLSRFQGRYYERGMSESVEACMSISWLSNPKVRITRVYGPLQIEHTSKLEFLFHSLTLAHVRLFRKQRRDQRYFNKSFQFSAELAETLKKLVLWQEEQAKDSGDLGWDWQFHHLDALSALYPPEIWEHHESNFFVVRFKLVLDALVENGDLIRTEDISNYRISPQALNTLSSVEIEKSRHQDSAKLSKWLVGLTGVIALATFLQIWK